MLIDSSLDNPDFEQSAPAEASTAQTIERFLPESSARLHGFEWLFFYRASARRTAVAPRLAFCLCHRNLKYLNLMFAETDDLSYRFAD
jgi:hypothetical protein